MSDLITDEIFTDGQTNIAASNMNGIIGLARVQPDVIANKVASSTMNVADQFLVLKTDNTLARAQFQTIVNSVSSTLTLANTAQNGMLRQVSGNATDYVGGDNNCHPLSSILPSGVVVNFAGPNIPAGWLKCDGTLISRTTYNGLYSAIGTVYGAGDGSTTFALPNFTGRIAAGAGGSGFGVLGTLGGSTSVTLAVGNLPSHSHSITDKTHTHTATDSGHNHTYSGPFVGGSNYTSGGGWGLGTGTTGSGAAVISVSSTATGITTTNAAGSGVAFAILPPYLSMYYIIKY